MDLSLLRIIFIVIFLCIGTIGNVLSIVTFTGKHSKKSSYTVFLTGLAIADLLMVYTVIIRDLSKEIQAISLQLYDLGFCRLSMFLLSVNCEVSVWMTVFLALERTFCIYFPLKVKNVCKPKNAIILASLVVAFFSLYSSHYIYGFRMYLSDSVSPVGMRVGNDSGVFGSLKTTCNSNNLISVKGKESNNSKRTTFPSLTEISANITERQVDIQNVLNSAAVTCSSNQPIITNDKPLTREVINDKPLTTGVTNDNPRTTQVTNDKPLTKEVTKDNPITTAVTNGNLLTTAETNDKPLTKEVTNDEPQTTGVTNDNPITKEVSNGYPQTTEVTNDKPPPTEVTNDNQAPGAAVGDLQPSCYPGKSIIDTNDSLVVFSNDTEPGMFVAFCCFVDEVYANIFKRIAWVETFGYYAVPVVILVVSNTATWIGVYRSSRVLSSGPSLLMLRRTRHVFVSTTLISVCFIVFLTPTIVVFVIEYVYQMPFTEDTLALMKWIFEYLSLCNYSSNFFLYVLSGSRFRKDLKAALCK